MNTPTNTTPADTVKQLIEKIRAATGCSDAEAMTILLKLTGHK